ncbi:MAG TPA: hypothetical protein VEJ86_11005 [Candidatus Binataceae bacterium]|nr:hypothetical protein [Candidatus Binataceae bacterium]
MAPWYCFSLNSDLLWTLDLRNSEIYRLFNIRYIIAPPNLELPNFLVRIVNLGQYSLYSAATNGYTEIGRITAFQTIHSQLELLGYNRAWLASAGPANHEFTAFLAPGEAPDRALLTAEHTAGAGTVESEHITPDSLQAHAKMDSPGLLVFKVTYHPNWRITVDGRPARALMVSPSYIGVSLEAGDHLVIAEYRSSRLKSVLLLIGLIVLVVTVAAWASGLERRLTAWLP